MGRFKRFYKKEFGTLDPMPKFLTSAQYKSATQEKKQGTTGKYTIVMTRSTIIMLGLFLLILSVVCFVGGFMLSKSIHEQKSQPIIIHTSQHGVPAQISFDHGTASNTEVQKEIAQFNETHDLNDEGAKAAAANMSARATEQNQTATPSPSKHAPPAEKSESIASMARDTFHKLVGIPEIKNLPKKTITSKKNDAGSNQKGEAESHKKDSEKHATEKELPSPDTKNLMKQQGNSHKSVGKVASSGQEHEKKKPQIKPKVETYQKAQKAPADAESEPLDSSYYNLDFYGQAARMSRSAQRRQREKWHAQKYADLNASNTTAESTNLANNENGIGENAPESWSMPASIYGKPTASIANNI